MHELTSSLHWRSCSDGAKRVDGMAATVLSDGEIAVVSAPFMGDA